MTARSFGGIALISMVSLALAACGGAFGGGGSDDSADLEIMLKRAGDCESVAKIVLENSQVFGGLPEPERDDNDDSVGCRSEYENEIGYTAYLRLSVPRDGRGFPSTNFDFKAGSFECTSVGMGSVEFACSAALTSEEIGEGGHQRTAIVTWENGYTVPTDGTYTKGEVESGLQEMVTAYVEYLTS